MSIAKRIKLVVDLSENSNNAAEQALALSKKTNAEVSPLYVVNTHYHKSHNVIQAMIRIGQKHIEMLKNKANEMGVNTVASKVLVGAPTREILKDTYASESDLLVVGAGGNSQRGSVPAKLVRKCKCNLMLARNHANGDEFKKIMVLTNDTQLEKAPVFAAHMSKELGAELTACHVVDVEEGLIKERVTYLPEVSTGAMNNGTRMTLGETRPLSPTLIEKMKESLNKEGDMVTASVEKIAGDNGINVKKVVLNGKPEEEIIRYAKAEGVDLIVTEHTKRNRFSQLISGSIPEKVARNAPCSVLIVNCAS